MSILYWLYINRSRRLLKLCGELQWELFYNLKQGDWNQSSNHANTHTHTHTHTQPMLLQLQYLWPTCLPSSAPAGFWRINVLFSLMTAQQLNVSLPLHLHISAYTPLSHKQTHTNIHTPTFIYLYFSLPVSHEWVIIGGCLHEYRWQPISAFEVLFLLWRFEITKVLPGGAK